MRSRGYIYLLLASVFLTVRCKKPYATPAISANNNYLVAEGVINAGSDSTIIKLNRTIKLSDNLNHTPELGARVTVEGDQGTVYQLVEFGNGVYASAGLNLDSSHKYHLHVITAAGTEYLSDYEAVKVTPPIDSVGYKVQAAGLQLYVNSHDPNNKTLYYRWDYQETWNFHARYQAVFITDGKELKYRTPDQQIYTCFGNHESSTIILASTAKLTQDVIYQNPLLQIDSTSEKLETKYSILVREYALTSEAYNFWQNLKKNTEQLGSIFDAFPSEVPGNIHCVTNPSEPVIGYISVGTVQQKRIFISETQLPQTWIPIYPYKCELDSLLYCHGGTPCQNDVALFLIPLGTKEFAISAISNKLGNAIGYLGTDSQCADCTIRGTTKRPAFW